MRGSVDTYPVSLPSAGSAGGSSPGEPLPTRADGAADGVDGVDGVQRRGFRAPAVPRGVVHAPRVAVVDDEESIRDVTSALLSSAGYRVVSYRSAEEALPALRREPVDVVVMDVSLQGMSGIDACRAMRVDPALARIPVVLVTGVRVSDADQVLGFDVGADDYVLKPWSPDVLVARVAAVLRRTGRRGDERRIVHGALSIDPARCAVELDGRPLLLTPTEFSILMRLASSPSRALTRAEILDHDHDGADREATDRNVDVHVLSIRRKLGVHRGLIETVFRVGYRLGPPDA